MNKTMQNSIQTRTQKLRNSMNKPQKKNNSKLKPISNQAVVSKFNPIQPKKPWTPMDELEFSSDKKTKDA